MSVAFLDSLSGKSGMIHKKKEKQVVQENIEKYSIKTPNQEISVNSFKRRRTAESAVLQMASSKSRKF